MRRRDFIAGLTGAATWPLTARAQQQTSLRRIGVLLFAKEDEAVIQPFLQGLEALGYIDGKTVAIEYRYGDGNHERLVVQADELVRHNPEVIFSFGGDLAPVVKRATATIPIVVVVSNDPVASGIVASLARPSVTFTGLSYLYFMLYSKYDAHLKESSSASSDGVLHQTTYRAEQC